MKTKWAGNYVTLKAKYDPVEDVRPIIGRVYTYEPGGYMIICDDNSEVCISYYQLRKHYTV